jgi:hypothetical protein
MNILRPRRQTTEQAYVDERWIEGRTEVKDRLQTHEHRQNQIWVIKTESGQSVKDFVQELHLEAKQTFVPRDRAAIL